MSFELFYEHPEKGPQVISLNQATMKFGSLLSNQAVVEGQGVEPIHALLEYEDGKWILSDMSESGLRINGKPMNIEATLKEGDELTLGRVKVVFRAIKRSPPPLPPPLRKKLEEANAAKGLVDSKEHLAPKEIVADKDVERRAKEPLFSPRSAESVGEVLEVVAFWDNQVLEMEHIRAGARYFSKFIIGDPTKGYFPEASNHDVDGHVVAEPSDSGYSLNLIEGMTARVRNGKTIKALGPGSYELTKKDIAHVRLGPIHYFLNFSRPQVLQLPPEGLKDPFLFGLMAVVMGIYVILSVALFLTSAPEKNPDEDIWALVHEPEKVVEIPKPETKPENIVQDVKTEPPPPEVPAPPPPKPVEPVQPKVPEKPKEQPKPKPEAPRPIESLTKAKTEVQKEAPKKSQQFGNEQKGAPRQGSSDTNVKGVADAPNPKGSAPNLSKLGLGVGKISSAGGVGAIHTNFKNSAGGAGGGSGSASKTLGLGGLSSGKSLGISGSASAVSQFGSAKLVKDNEVGGAFKGAREGRAVNVSASDPLVSGGLSQEEIAAVVNKNINQIRHCYSRLLQKNPDAVGKVNMHFVIGASGRVSLANIESSTFSDPEIGSCISGVIKRLQFPQPRGGSDVKVNYPFLFNPVS